MNYFNPGLIKSIVKKIGTPVYIYSKQKILQNLAAYQKAFASLDHLICYSLKANSNGAIAGLLAKNGSGADVVSGGELYRALRAGFKPSEIIFSGVGKTEEEIAYALRSGILFINVESFEELLAIETVAARLKLSAPISVRINPDVDPHTHKYITTGKLGGKFGVDFKEALRLYAYAAASKRLKPVGIQFHLGSQIDSPRPYVLALKPVKKFMGLLQKEGLNLKHLDIGGGWGVKEGAEMLPPALLAKSMVPELKQFKGMKVILEPGRSLVASAGALAVRVLYRKKSGRRNFVIVDGAMNDLIRPALYGARHPVVTLEKRKGRLELFDLVGPVCESADFLAKDVCMPMPLQGDLLLVLSTGAYGFSMSSQYNSRPRAVEVMMTGRKTWKLVRRRETLRDLTAKEII